MARSLLGLSEDTAGHVALAEVVLDRALLSGSALGEGSGATERTGKGSVLHADDADVGGATGGTGAGHASGHLDLDGEVLDGGGGETSNTDTGDVLHDGCVLEGGGVGASGGGVDLGGQGTGTVLVDLVEGHGDGAVVGSGGKTRCGSSTCGFGNTTLSSCGLGASRGSTGTASATTGKSIEEATLGTSCGTGTGSSTSHEHGDSGTSVNGTATLGASKSRGLATHLAGADDGSISLRTAERRSAVARSTVLDGKTRHGYTIGTLDLRNDTVGLDGGGNSSNGSERVTHLDGYEVG